MTSEQITTAADAPTLNGRAVRLIATDIDGTILPYAALRSGRLSDRTVAAFQAAREAGVVIVLVSGRPVRSLRPVGKSLAMSSPVIASNGAVTYDLGTDKVISTAGLEATVLYRAKELISSIHPQVSFAAETLNHFHMEEDFAAGSLWFDPEHRRAAGIRDEELLFGPLNETLRAVGYHPDTGGASSGPVVKLLAKTHDLDADDFLYEAKKLLGSTVTVTHSAPGVSLLEIAAQGVNKACGLRRFAEEHGINPEEAIAFGDMPNDVEMLQWAGVSWAVESGHPTAVSAATHLAGSCEDDGVAEVIEQLVDGQL